MKDLLGIDLAHAPIDHMTNVIVFTHIHPLVPEKKILKGFCHIWAWRHLVM